MPQLRFAKTSFLGGEISPRAYGRVGFEIYSQGCKSLKNVIVDPLGGALKRPGTEFVSDVGSQGVAGSAQAIPENHILIPYVRQPGEEYICIYTGDADYYTRASTNLLNTDYRIAFYRVQNDDFLAPECDEIDNGYTNGVYGDLGNDLDSDQIQEVQWAIIEDKLVICNEFETPVVCDANTIYDWMKANGVIGGSIPTGSAPSGSSKVTYGGLANDAYLATPYTPISDPISGTLSGTSGTVTNTFAAASVAPPTQCLWRLYDVTAAAYKYAWCTASTTTTANLVLLETFSGTSVQTFEIAEFGADRNDYTQKYPSSVAFHQGRAVFGGHGRYGIKLAASRVQSFGEFTKSGDVTNDYPFEFTLAQQDQNSVSWMVPGRNLSVGTFNEELVLAQGYDTSLGLGPENPPNIISETAQGASRRMPIKMEGGIIYIDKNRTRLLELAFNQNEDRYRANNLMEWSEHLLRYGYTERSSYAVPKLKQIVYQKSAKTIWAVDSNGLLYSLLHDRSQNLNAWCRHTLGGNLDGEAPKVLSLAVVPAKNGDYDQLYLTVKRTVDSSTVIYLERLTKRWDLGDTGNSSTDIDDKPVYVDSALMVQGSDQTTFSGFDHLEGETVQVVADGNYVGTKTVSSGDITLDSAADEVIAGLSYEAEIIPVAPQAGSAFGVPTGHIRRISEALIEFVRTLHAKYGPDGKTTRDTISFRDASQIANENTTLFTGIKRVAIDGNNDREASVAITSDLPVPMEVRSITFKGELGEA